MADAVAWIFTGLAALSFAAGLASFLEGIRFSVRVRRSGRPPSGWTPRALVIVACKGVDPGLEANLAALMEQDYPAFRVVFALDDFEDEAHEVIRAVTAGARVKATVVAADPVRNATGKAAALIRAAKEVTSADEVIAFMDSDARPPTHWLRSLVAPLEERNVGAATTYRWYLHDRSLASAARSAWNAAGTNLMFSDRTNFAWGGSYAIRRETFERTYIAAKWGTALSDDMVVTQAVKGAGLRVRYVPEATVLTDEPADWRSTMEWTTRQTVMMRAYDPRVTRFAALAYGTIAGSVDLGIGLAVLALVADPAYWLPTGLLFAHVPLVAGKGLLRLGTFRRITGQRLGPSAPFALACVVVPWVALANLAYARRLRVISWRGVLYELRGPVPIRVIRR